MHKHGMFRLLLYTVLLGFSLAFSSVASAEETDTESEASGVEDGPKEGEASSEDASSTDAKQPPQKKAEEPVVTEAKVQPAPPAPEIPISAGDRVQQALDRLAAAQGLVVAAEDGQEETERAELASELVAARRALELALVEIGKLERVGELRALLEESGLVLTKDEKAVLIAEEERKRGLTAERFQEVVAAITSVSFSEGRMQKLRAQLKDETLTSSQAWALVELFKFSRDRVEALVLLHPQIVDPENFSALLSGLKFESDRETVRSRLGLDG